MESSSPSRRQDCSGQICETAQAEGLMLLYHNCGTVEPLLADIAGIPAAGYSFGNAVDMETVLKAMPEDRIVIGNIDPVGVLRNGTPDGIRRETKALMEKCCGYPNFVIASGCDIPPMTPIENLQAFFDAAEEFYRMGKTPASIGGE